MFVHVQIVPISTACSALDYFVTDTTADAEACVGFLRERSLGRNTFVILEKIAGLAAKMDAATKAP